MTNTRFNMRVLVVEDDVFSNKYFHNIVNVAGHDCRVAKNGKQGLEVFEQYNPHVVISDIYMPVMDGLEMLAAIRKKKSDAIVIMATAFDSEQYAIKALELGANNYMKKPVHADNLKRLLSKYFNLLKNRSIASDIVLEVERLEFRKHFKSDMESVPLIVEHLIKQTGNAFDDSQRIGLELGLAELLANAVEHGNLSISYEEKSRALEENRLDELYRQRLGEPEIAKRTVDVDFVLDAEKCQWTITDQGEGFDWKAVQNPLKDEGILKLHGRGIFISRFNFDEMEYSGKGNVVRVMKKIKKQ